MDYNDLHSFKYHGGDADRKFDRDLDEEDEEIEFLPSGKSENYRQQLINNLSWNMINFNDGTHTSVYVWKTHFTLKPIRCDLKIASLFES